MSGITVPWFVRILFLPVWAWKGLKKLLTKQKGAPE